MWASLTIQIKNFNPTFLCISRDIWKEKIKQEHKKSMNDLQIEEQKMKQEETEYDDFHLYLSDDDELQIVC